MLAILLMLLKVLLYIILFIILIVVLCILTVLFVPIRYKVEGEKYDAIKLDVRVSFLLHIVSFKYNMEDKTNISFKIFGKDILKKKSKKDKKTKSKKFKRNINKKKNNNKKTYQSSQEKNNQNVQTEIKEKSKSINNEVDTEGKSNNIKIKNSTEENNSTVNIETDSSEHINKKITFNDRVKLKREELNRNKANKKTKIKQHKKEHNKDKSTNSKNNIKQVLSSIKDFIKNEENRAVIKMIKDKILKIIKHILPKKFKAKMIIGTGDPASTGYVVGAVSILYTVTGNKLKVVPDFTEKIFQGCFYGKGKIYLIVLLKNTLSIILDKRVRKLYKAYKAWKNRFVITNIRRKINGIKF